MSGKKRILFVDDSSMLRRMLAEVLVSHPRLEVIAPTDLRPVPGAPKGIPAELVILDLENLGENLVHVVSTLRRRDARVPILVFTSLTARAAEQTMLALAAGATDFAVKPARAGHFRLAMEYLRSELLPKVLELVHANGDGQAPPPRREGAPPMRLRSPADLIVIGGSSGGPQALAEVLGQLPADFPLPILVVQHMPPLFTQELARHLSGRCRLIVQEARDGDMAEPGVVSIAPGDFHMAIEATRGGRRIRLNQEPPEHACRPAIDVLFRSAAVVSGGGALGIILTGMGNDGIRGSLAIRRAGGQVLVQDPALALAESMPRSAVETGIANAIAPLAEFGSLLTSLVGEPVPASAS